MKNNFADLIITVTTKDDVKVAEERIRNAIRSAGYDVGSFEVEEFVVGEAQFQNWYRCPECKTEWNDVWDSMCDDECPECGERDISPHYSEQI